MSVDLSQFLGVFYDEARTLVGDLRAHVNALESRASDPRVFTDSVRAAHSICGAAASFGFDGVVEHSRCIEHTLTTLRDGACHVDAATQHLLRTAVDDLAVMLAQLERGQDIDTEATQRFADGLTRIAAPNDCAPQSMAQADAARRWRIELSAGAFQLGGSPPPDSLFDALAALGRVEVRQVQVGSVGLAKGLVGDCQIGWVLRLTTTASEQAIRAVTDWVEDPEAVSVTEEPVKQPRVCALTGPLHHGTLELARDELRACMTGAGEVTVKLGGIDTVDIAGLHLLVAASADAPARGVNLHWEDVPTCAAVLADRLGLRQTLRW